jgi:hypothetical protein
VLLLVEAVDKLERETLVIYQQLQKTESALPVEESLQNPSDLMGYILGCQLRDIDEKVIEELKRAHKAGKVPYSVVDLDGIGWDCDDFELVLTANLANLQEWVKAKDASPYVHGGVNITEGLLGNITELRRLVALLRPRCLEQSVAAKQLGTVN